MFDLYQVSDISITLLRACIEAARKDPAVAYAQACRFQNAPLKDAACRLMLERPLFPLSTSPDLDCMTGGQMAKFVQYRQDAGTVAAKVADGDLRWLENAGIPYSCKTCQSPKDLPSLHRRVPTWLFDFLKNTAAALQKVSKGETVKEQGRLNDALEAMNGCPNLRCRMGASQALLKISDELAMRVDAAVAKIEIPV